MKYPIIILILVCLMPLLAHSASTSILIVAGKVTDSEGKSASKGLPVIVENQNNKLSLDTTIGLDGEEGTYNVAFIDFDGKSVAATGDNIKVSVKDANGKVSATQEQQLTDADIAAAQVIINLKLTALTPSPTPSPKPTPETPKDTVAEIFSVKLEGSPAKSGDRVVITVKAEPGGKAASFSIQGVSRASNVPMREMSSGIYVGDFQPVKGEDVTNATVTVSFEDGAGNKTANSSRSLTIDTIPPPAPKNLSVSGGSIKLENVAKVEVTGQATPGSEVTVSMSNGLISLEKTGKVDSTGVFKPSFDASNLKDGVVTITAFEAQDQAGNLGEKFQINVLKDTKAAEIPDFFINSPTPSQNVEGGKPVIFVITVFAKSGFNNTITLIADKLPKGAFASFNPKELKLSPETPLQSSQLTISGLENASEGENEFSVIAFAAGAASKSISLKLKKQKESAFITLLLSDSKVKLTDKIKVQGQIVLPPGSPKPQGKVQIVLTYSPQKGDAIERTFQADDKLRYQDEFQVNTLGPLNVSVKWIGDEVYKSAQQSDTFEVAKGDSQLQLQLTSAESVKIGSTLKIVGSLQALIKKEALKGETVQIDIIKPSGTKKIQKATTNEFGKFDFEVQFDSEGPWEFEASWNGNESYLAAKSETLTVPVSKENAKAIIVLGGGSESENPAWNQFAGLAIYVYKIFKRRDLTDDDIYYLSPTEKKLGSVDSKTSREALKFAITDWAKKQTSKNVPLFIYLLSHNLDDKFLLEKSKDREVVLTPEDLDEWLSVLDKEVEVFLMIEACFSGTFIIKKRSPTEPILPKNNRVIVTSAKEDKQALILRDLSSFSKSFFDQIVRNENIRSAFLKGRDTIKALRSLQTPQIDADGDGRPNDPIRDFPSAEKKYIPEFRLYLASVPEIKEVIAKPNELKAGAKSAIIEAKVVGTNISSVEAEILPPNFNPNATFNSWDDLNSNFERIALQKVSEGVYRGEYNNFALAGEYSIVVHVENPDGSAVPAETTVKVLAPSSDVNSDGEVNVFDLVIVASNIGQEVKQGDVNGDGKVDIFDLVLVASRLGEKSSASPSLETTQIDYSQYLPILEKAYQLLQASSNPSPEFEKARRLLEYLISLAKPVVIVKETKLLPNYPNPFNPETWIPFQLAKESEVTIRIYNVSGQLVRTLSLGHKDSGYYIQKEKAAYWDGRNELGEMVASGVYFYTLQAGDFIDTRRMLVVK